jgi:OOP family OmpA-OmpF porin
MSITSRNVAALGCMAAAALVAPASMAQGAGWYGGASIGRSAATIDNERITSGLAGQGLATSSISDRDRDTGYRLFGGYGFHRNFGLEAGWFHLGEMGFTATTTPAGTLAGDVRFQGLNLDIVGTLPIGGRFSLLGRIGGAYVRTRGAFTSTGAVTLPYPGNGTSARHFGARYGAGVGWRLADAWDLRLEGERLRVDDSVGNRGHVDMLSLGVVYYFGGRAAPARAAAAAPAYASAPVAPPPPVVREAAVAAPPVPLPVPAAPAPAPLVTVRFSADALFDFDRSALHAQGRRDLDAFVGELRRVQYDRIEVVGHTDRLGSGAYNAALSRRRAVAVAAHLAAAGIPADRITSSGAGEADPLTATTDCRGKAATPALIACLQPDRRVDVQVRGMRSPVEP